MKNVRVVKNESGFSLVELMVVVAIIGILASLAIPSVGKYMAKARQSEAKTQLSSLYTAEKAFYAEYTAYHPAFGAVGYSPEGKLRYQVGMPGTGTGVAGVANGFNTTLAGTAAMADTVAYCLAGASAGVVSAQGCTILNGADGSAPIAAVPAVATGVNNATFVAGATAVVYQTQVDVWTMNHNKELLNTTNGIQ